MFLLQYQSLSHEQQRSKSITGHNLPFPSSFSDQINSWELQCGNHVYNSFWACHEGQHNTSDSLKTVCGEGPWCIVTEGKRKKLALQTNRERYGQNSTYQKKHLYSHRNVVHFPMQCFKHQTNISAHSLEVVPSCHLISNTSGDFILFSQGKSKQELNGSPHKLTGSYLTQSFHILSDKPWFRLLSASSWHILFFLSQLYIAILKRKTCRNTQKHTKFCTRERFAWLHVGSKEKSTASINCWHFCFHRQTPVVLLMTKAHGCCTGFAFWCYSNVSIPPSRKAPSAQHWTKYGLTTLRKTECSWTPDNTWGLYHAWSSCSAERNKH